ncbi:MAG TPA: Shedu immune nuclease family protein, partial [Methylomirabilota bacterium]|nr:Shedu immune nuclease family protein [Methylomirabilota bacterium]
LVDFLVRNSLTSNAALIEIKTPATKLLAVRPYRGGVYTTSEDLSGAVMQVLNYRFSLQNEFKSLTAGLPGRLDAFEPRCVVIVGKTQEIRNDDIKRRSFELFRGHSQGVVVITFDELFEKTRRLINVLETTT